MMLRGVVPALETHHKVRILDDGLDAAVRLSHRYIPDRQLPDKAVSLLDTACARARAGPERRRRRPVEDARAGSTTSPCRRACSSARRRSASTTSERLAAIAADARRRRGTSWRELDRSAGRRRGSSSSRFASIAARSRRARRRAAGDSEAGQRRGARPTARDELAQLRRRARGAAGREAAHARRAWTRSIVGEVVSGWTGIPVGKMVRDEIATVLELEEQLGARVIGQDHALEAISRRIRTSAANIDDPHKPKGVFMLVGPSGVGKTETALALSRPAVTAASTTWSTINMSRVPGVAQGLHAQGLAAGLRRLRRGRRAHRSRAPPAVLRRAARRSREGAPRRAGAVLPGVRQGRAWKTAKGARSTSRTRSSC